MHQGRFKLETVLIALLLLCAVSGFAQSSTIHGGTSGTAQGNLTVIATVVSSVGLVIGPDGEQRMIVANAADPSDNVSRLRATQTVTLAQNPDASIISNVPNNKKKR